MRKKTTEEFIKESKEIHGDKYDYSLVDYKNNSIKVNVICKKHGIFETYPSNHIHKNYGCQKCSKNYKPNTIEYIKKVKNIHGDKYDYSLVEYKNAHKPIIIICKKHGIFEISPNKHIIGQGCSKCFGKIKKTTDEFIKDAKIIHGDEFDYSKSKYINSKSKITIICKKHGKFELTPDAHINKKVKCKKCSESKGERIISEILELKNIKYIKQKTFEGCVYKSKLKFDFYLSDYNMCIEYDGIQHYKPIGFFGGVNSLKMTKIRDEIKNNYCKDNNIQLLRIKYDDDIEEIINKTRFPR